MRVRFVDNPVVGLESRELMVSRPMPQLRVIPRGIRAKLSWLIYVVMFGVAVSFYLFNIFATVTGFDPFPVMETDVGRMIRITLVLLGVLHLFGLVFQSNSIGASLIVREHQEQRWELLLLTGIPTYQLAWGKGWAGLWHLRERILYVTVMRTAMTLSIGSLGVTSAYYYGSGIFRPPALPALLLLPLLTFGFTVMVSAASMAVGLLVSANSQRPGRALAGGGCSLLSVWVGMMLCSCSAASIVGPAFSSSGGAADAFFILCSGATLVSLLDGGLTMMSFLSYYQIPATSSSTYLAAGGISDWFTILVASLVAFLAYFVLIQAFMQMTESSLRQRGVATRR